MATLSKAMEVFELSGVGHRERIGIEGIDLDTYERLTFLNPDKQPNPDPQARRLSAKRWSPISLRAVLPHDRRSTPIFTDALGPGLMLPGCELAVSEKARQLLSGPLASEAAFLPVDVRGAPGPYWLLYALEYCGAVDMAKSVFTEPYASALDRRAMLRKPAFEQSANLEQRLVFRIPGSSTFVPPDVTYATEAFLNLVQKLKLSGFTFLRILSKDRKLQDGEKPVLVSRGAQYVPMTDLPPPAT